MSDDEGLVKLSSAIEAVRRELLEARHKGQESASFDEVTFLVDKVTVEFSGVVTRTGGAQAEARFWVFNVGARGERASSATHRITVDLTPQTAQGGGVRVSDRVDKPPSQ